MIPIAVSMTPIVTRPRRPRPSACVSSRACTQAPPVHAALPQRLGGFPFWRGGQPLLDVLVPWYRQAGTAGKFRYEAVTAAPTPSGQGGSPFSTARLTQPAGFAGVNGAFRFNSNGRIQRNLAIIEVRNGQAVVTERAARSFDAVGF